MRVLRFLYLNVTFYFYLFIFSLVVIPALTVFIAFCRFFRSYRFTLKRLRRAMSWYGAVIIRVLPFPLVRVKYTRKALLNPKGPYVFICNHRSSSDPFLMAVLPFECVQVVNIWPFRLPVWGLIARIAGYLSVREMPFEDFSARTTKLLREGVSIVAFPEGTRSRDKSVGQFHGAIFRVALKTKTPIVPLCITGNETIPPIGSIFLRPGVVKIHQLKPLLWEDYGAIDPFKLKKDVREMIVNEVVAMELYP